MKEKKRVNLGCWLADQFHHAQGTGRNLILGSLITHLAVFQGLDLNDHDLHMVCEMKPFELRQLGYNGVIWENGDVCEFTVEPCLQGRRMYRES